MSRVFNFGSPNVPGWENTQNSFGILGNTQNAYTLTPSMGKGGKFYDWWYWTHGGISWKQLVRGEKIGKDVAFFYPSAGPAPEGSRVVAQVGILVNADDQARLEQSHGFHKGGYDYGLHWTHPLLCVVTADSIPMNEKMVFPASTNHASDGFKSIARFKFLIRKGSNNVGETSGNYNSDWDWGVCMLVSPPRDPDIDINFCKSSISNANTEFCTSIMQRSCSADDIKVGGNGVCSVWCSRNPDLCDPIKVAFCNSHPNDPYCDCINSNSRASYINDMKSLKPESRALPKICNTKLCNSRTDLVDVFQTSSYLYDKKNYTCPPLQIIDQSVNVQGDNNVLDTNQNVNNNTGIPVGGAPPTNVDTPEAQKKRNYLYLLLLLILIVVVVLFSGDDGGEDYDAPPVTQFRQKIQNRM